MTRPLVTVYQEIAQPSSTPTTPDLHTIILGPCYDIKDYPDDAAETLLEPAYGSLEQPAGGGSAYAPPVAGSNAVTINAYPGQSPGSVVDHASVRLFLQTPRVVLGSTQVGVAPSLGSNVTTSESDRTLVLFPGGDVIARAIRPGDRVILTSSRGTQTAVRTVATVGEPNASGLSTGSTQLRLTQALPTPDTKATGRLTAVAASNLIGSFATGTLTVVAGSALVDGETFTLDDGVNPATVFEYNSAGGVTGSNVLIAFTGGDSSGTVKTATIAAINGVGASLRMTASPGAGDVINLAADRCLTAGNVAITDTVADAGFTHTGMTGGANEGETFTINDGTNPATTFEFDRDGVVSGSNVAVTINPGMTATQVRDAMVTAINGVGAGLLVTAAPSGTAYVDVTADVGGAEANNAITETVANAGFVVTGLTGGANPSTSWAYNASGEARVERVLATQELVDASRSYITFPEPGSDVLVLKGGVSLTISLTPHPSTSTPTPSSSNVACALSYARLYIAYRALRQDLLEPASVTIDDVTSRAGISSIRNVGRIDARNPLAAGLNVALQNAGRAPIWYVGVPSQDADGYTVARAAIEARRDFHCVIPMTLDPAVGAAENANVSNIADPNAALRDGVVQKFRAVLMSGSLPTATTIADGTINGVAQQPGTSTGRYRTISLANGSAVDVTGVLPGDTVVFGLPSTGAPSGWQNRRGSHLVAHVNNNHADTNPAYPANDSVFEIEPGTSRWDDSAGTGAGDIEVVIKAPDGTVKVSKLGSLTVTVNSGNVLWAMRNPTTVGGPYTVTYTAGSAPAVSVVGFVITVTYVNGVTTHTDVAAMVAAHPVLSGIVTATAGGTASNPINAGSGPAAIEVQSGGCTAEVVVNDNLFDRLEDTSATFLTSNVRAGDTIEIPIDVNNYAASAFDGRVLTFRVAQVLNEQRLLIQNGRDDGASAANELPHYYMRDYANRVVDNTAPNAIRYRIRRALAKDDQVVALTSYAQGYRNKRMTLVWPGEVEVSNLLDGSLPRTSPAVRAPAGWQPGYYAACMIGGALAGLPPHHGLTNLGFAGIKRLRYSSGYFSETQLTRLSDGGWFVLIQRRPTDLPSCLHQLTTDTAAVETGELSVVRTVDFVSMFLQGILEEYLGQYNVLPETSNEMFRALTDGIENLKSRRTAKIGAPLTDGSVTQIKVADFAKDRYQVYVSAQVPGPLNNVDLHVVVG